MEENKANKPEYIENQTNNNCQQFFGPVSGCVFAMPGSTVNMPSENKASSQDAEKRVLAVYESRLCESKADWGIVFRLLVEDGIFRVKDICAGTKYINTCCGANVTTEDAISRSLAMLNLAGTYRVGWTAREANRETAGKLLLYNTIAKTYYVG